MFPSLHRRQFLTTSAGLVSTGAMASLAMAEGDRKLADVKGKIGVTLSTFSGHVALRPTPGKFTFLELPQICRDELGMQLLDLNTSVLASEEPAYLDRCRAAIEAAGCIATNLKMNQKGLDMNSPDAGERERALAIYKRSIDTAARLGCRWARPLPLTREKPDIKIHVASYQALADHAAKHGVQMLVENYLWMEDDPDSVASLVKRIGRNVAPCPDIGNWANNSVRYDGLARSFPGAVSCDFKFFDLTADDEHPAFDLRRCWQIGHDAGFRGPWCFEHTHPDRRELFRQLTVLRDRLQGWIDAKKD